MNEKIQVNEKGFEMKADTSLTFRLNKKELAKVNRIADAIRINRCELAREALALVVEQPEILQQRLMQRISGWHSANT